MTLTSWTLHEVVWITRTGIKADITVTADLSNAGLTDSLAITISV
jgi:hypothetical protein